jgi:integrase
VKLPRGRRPFAVVWTKRRVKEWKQTGERPVVAVWTPGQLSAFLSSVAGHPLFAAFRLIGMRGLRRGEACGLQWGDLDLEEEVAYISRQLQEDARGRLGECPLKTETGPYQRVRASTERARERYRSRPLGRKWAESASGVGRDAGHDS